MEPCNEESGKNGPLVPPAQQVSLKSDRLLVWLHFSTGRRVQGMKNERSNQQLVLARIPAGIAVPEDFSIKESAIPALKDGQLLIEAHYVGVDAALRLIVRDSDEFLFRVRPGDVVHGSIAGQVIESNNSDFRVGDFVSGSLGVQRFSVSDGTGLERCDV